MRRVLDMRLPGDRGGEHDGLQREDVEQAEHAVLVEQHEADQHHEAGEHVSDIEDESVHQKLRETKSSKRAEQPEHERDAEEFRHAEDAHLGDRGLEQDEQEAADGELAEIARARRRHRRRARSPACARPQGTKMQAMSDI